MNNTSTNAANAANENVILMPNGVAPPEPKRRKMSVGYDNSTEKWQGLLKTLKCNVIMVIDTPQIFSKFMKRVEKVLRDVLFQIKTNVGRDHFCGYEIVVLDQSHTCLCHAQMECKVIFDPAKKPIEDFCIDASVLKEFIEMADNSSNIIMGIDEDVVHIVIHNERDSSNSGARITIPRKVYKDDRIVFPDLTFSYSMDFKQLDFRGKIRLLQGLGVNSIEFSIYKNEKTRQSPSKMHMNGMETEEIMENYFVISASSDKMREVNMYYRSVTRKCVVDFPDDNGLKKSAVITIVEDDEITPPSTRSNVSDSLVDWSQMKPLYSGAFSSQILDSITKDLDGRNKMTIYMEPAKPLVVHFQVDNMTFIRFVMSPLEEITDEE